jgi:hypothetical protein
MNKPVEEHYKILVQPARGQGSYNLLLLLKIQKGNLATYLQAEVNFKNPWPLDIK